MFTRELPVMVPASERAGEKTLRRRQPLMITLSFSRNVRRLLNVFYTNKESSCLQYTRRSEQRAPNQFRTRCALWIESDVRT
jgi:hypothetical protein